jgi:hypothetical protein
MKTSDKQNLKHSVILTHNKEKRLQLIEGLKKYLDNPEDINSYLKARVVRANSVSNFKDAVVQFEDRDGNIEDTNFSYSIEELEGQTVILPSPYSDKEQCQRLLDELIAKLDTHRLNIAFEISGDNANPYDPHTDDNF